MTCVYCEDDTADRDSYVTYGAVIFCDPDCLAEWYVDEGSTLPLSAVEQNYELVNQ